MTLGAEHGHHFTHGGSKWNAFPAAEAHNPPLILSGGREPAVRKMDRWQCALIFEPADLHSQWAVWGVQGLHMRLLELNFHVSVTVCAQIQFRI